MFTSADIKKHKHKEPFVPFRVVTSSGESFDVLHPELVMVGAREIAIGRPTTKDPSVYEEQIWVALLHVASIQEISSPAKPISGDGKP